MPNTPTARRTTVGDGTLTIEVANLDPDTADRITAILGALDVTVEDNQPAKPATKLSAAMSVADLEHELGIHRRERQLDEWEKTGEVR